MTIKNVKNLTGDSSILVRKGKKIVVYDYSFTLEWKLTINNADNTGVEGSIEGEYFFPEVSNDVENDGEEFDCQYRTKDEDN